MQSAKIQRQGKNPTESKQVRGKNTYINEDFSRETMELRKQSWKEVKANCDKVRVVYPSYRALIVKKGGNFAK